MGNKLKAVLRLLLTNKKLKAALWLSPLVIILLGFPLLFGGLKVWLVYIGFFSGFAAIMYCSARGIKILVDEQLK